MQTTGKERRRTAKRTSRERWWTLAERRTAVDGAGTVKGKAGWPRGGKAVCCADDRQGTATNGKADIKRTLVDGGRAKNGGGRSRHGEGQGGWPRGGKAVCCADDRQGTATNGKADIKRTLVDGGRAKNGGGRSRHGEGQGGVAKGRQGGVLCRRPARNGDERQSGHQENAGGRWQSEERRWTEPAR